jgi:hypothetical protein
MTIVAVGILFAKGESMKLFMILIFASLKVYSGAQVFEAVASTKGEVVYVERHTLTLEEDTLIQSLTEYLDLEGRSIGSMKSNYTQSLSVPEYTLRDERQQSIQGIRWLENKLDIFTQTARGAKVIHQRMGLDPLEVYIASPGLIYYIGAHLKELIAGHIFKFKYVIPGKFQTYDFYIETIQHNQQVAEFEVKMQEWPMRYLGPRLKIIYSVQKKRVLFYEGPSNLRDKDGKMMSVKIEYKYRD